MRLLTKIGWKVAAGLLCAWFLFQPGQARAVVGFSASSLNGSFAFQLNKFGTCQNIVSAVGVMQFDGAGTMSGSFKAYESNKGGGGPKIQSSAISGTYTVNNDGTGKIIITSPDTRKFAFVIDSSGTSAERIELIDVGSRSWACAMSGYAIQQ